MPTGELLMRPWVKKDADKIPEKVSPPKVVPNVEKVEKKLDGLPKDKKIEAMRNTGLFNPQPKAKWKVGK